MTPSDRVSKLLRETRGQPSEGDLRAMVEEALEAAALVADGWAEQYPPDVFVSDGPEGRAGKMGRHVATMIAEDVRRLVSPGTVHHIGKGETWRR